ncbi:hypothetical protein [Companilactobacillus nuruki]|uniref:Uncharacterized protein n=1 Tax=Companilactobacillus nuruki TaxID=1993540 RepID=A0A2N7AUU6_9LACO|nr:hypothetical protein [Companilactobacillus nuruki]PMD71355.1 hypothetical protein CBP76_05720 [Companilactobacillus nuruki]
MNNNIAIIVTDVKNIPYINGNKTIFISFDQNVPDIPNSKFIKIPNYISLGEDLANVFTDTVRLPDTTGYRNILQYVYFSHMVAFYISQQNYSKIIFEDDDLRDQVLKQFDNSNRYANKYSLT